MNKRITLETPVMLIGEDRWRPVFTPRTSVELRALIETHLREHPAEPLRLDVHESEGEALQAALVGLRCGWAYSRHADAIRYEAGFGRFIFWGPGWTLPKDRRGQFRAYYTADEIADVAAATCYDYGFMLPRVEAAQGKADELAQGHLQLSIALAAWVRLTLPQVVGNQWQLTRDEARLFALLITPSGKTAEGNVKFLAVRDIARRLGVSPATVQKRVKRLREIKSVGTWLDRHAQRKARGSRWQGCTKQKKD